MESPYMTLNHLIDHSLGNPWLLCESMFIYLRAFGIAPPKIYETMSTGGENTAPPKSRNNSSAVQCHRRPQRRCGVSAFCWVCFKHKKVAEITSQQYRQLSDGFFFPHIQLILLGNIGKVMYRLRPPKQQSKGATHMGSDLTTKSLRPLEQQLGT